MEIRFTATTLKRANRIKPKNETMVDFIITAVQNRIYELERDENDRRRNKKS